MMMMMMTMVLALMASIGGAKNLINSSHWQLLGLKIISIQNGQQTVIDRYEKILSESMMMMTFGF